MSIDARDTAIAKLDFRIREVSRVRLAIPWSFAFGAFVMTLEPLERVMGDALMFLGSLAAGAASWWIADYATSRLIGHWTALHSRLVTERELPRADVITRRK